MSKDSLITNYSQAHIRLPSSLLELVLKKILTSAMGAQPTEATPDGIAEELQKVNTLIQSSPSFNYWTWKNNRIQSLESFLSLPGETFSYVLPDDSKEAVYRAKDLVLKLLVKGAHPAADVIKQAVEDYIENEHNEALSLNRVEQTETSQVIKDTERMSAGCSLYVNGYSVGLAFRLIGGLSNSALSGMDSICLKLLESTLKKGFKGFLKKLRQQYSSEIMCQNKEQQKEIKKRLLLKVFFYALHSELLSVEKIEGLLEEFSIGFSKNARYERKDSFRINEKRLSRSKPPLDTEDKLPISFRDSDLPTIEILCQLLSTIQKLLLQREFYLHKSSMQLCAQSFKEPSLVRSFNHYLATQFLKSCLNAAFCFGVGGAASMTNYVIVIAFRATGLATQLSTAVIALVMLMAAIALCVQASNRRKQQMTFIQSSKEVTRNQVEP